MYIFVVKYVDSEKNTFQVYKPESDEVARSYVDTPLADHVCGYFIRQDETNQWLFDGVPKLQRRKFCGADTPSAFIDKLQAEAEPLTAADVQRLHHQKRDYINERRAQEKQTMAEAETVKEKKAKEPKAKKEKAPKEAKAPKAKKEKVAKAEGEGRTRWSPDPTLKIKRLVEECPRREGSVGHANWQLYKGNPTVAKFKESGGKMGYLKTDVENKNVELVAG